MKEKLKKCPFCAETIKAEAIVCRYCNRDLPKPEKTQLLKNTEPILASGENIKISKPNRIIRWSLFAGFLIIISLVFFFNSDEQRAKRTVDAHLKAIKTGKGNPYSTVDVSAMDEVFINVIRFKYLSKLSEEDITTTESITYDRDWYDLFDKDNYDTYEEFLNAQLDMWGDEAKRVGDTVVHTYEDEYLEFDFLYDLTVTNGLGQLIYKKYVFTVRSKWDGFKIVSFEEY